VSRHADPPRLRRESNERTDRSPSASWIPPAAGRRARTASAWHRRRTTGRWHTPPGRDPTSQRVHTICNELSLSLRIRNSPPATSNHTGRPGRIDHVRGATHRTGRTVWLRPAAGPCSPWQLNLPESRKEADLESESSNSTVTSTSRGSTSRYITYASREASFIRLP
jgi:hypothetical protein